MIACKAPSIGGTNARAPVATRMFFACAKQRYLRMKTKVSADDRVLGALDRGHKRARARRHQDALRLRTETPFIRGQGFPSVGARTRPCMLPPGFSSPAQNKDIIHIEIKVSADGCVRGALDRRHECARARRHQDVLRLHRTRCEPISDAPNPTMADARTTRPLCGVPSDTAGSMPTGNTSTYTKLKEGGAAAHANCRMHQQNGRIKVALVSLSCRTPSEGGCTACSRRLLALRSQGIIASWWFTARPGCVGSLNRRARAP